VHDLTELNVFTDPKDTLMRKALTLFALTAVLALPLAANGYGDQDIVDTAVETGSFTTLVAAVQAAGLVDILKADGPLTVFAPTDEAFAKLPEGTVESLLEPENIEQLRAILAYHVVSGQVMAANVTDGLEAASLNGATLTFAVDESGARVGDASIVATDIATSNGLIHVIDTVLIPAE
jgi:uncharacterized surface protein with fasciclin (FAS1) repeats